MSVHSDTSAGGRTYYPGPGIVVTSAYIETAAARYQVRDLIIWIDERRNPRRMELAAWHEGRRIVLFTSTNRRVFEQVRRAVVRAVEANSLPRP